MTRDTLLLVEDDATTREVLLLLLAADRWTVTAAESGEAALDAVQTAPESPGVILCDLHLPGIRGAALARALRTFAGGSVLLAMSASPPSEAESGYDGFLQKPLRPADLRAALAGTPLRQPESPASETQVEQLPVLAPETLLRLQQQMGARAKDLYAFALADAGDRLRRMEEAVTRGDSAALQSEAHALKGSAGMIGAQRLAAIAAETETMNVRFTADAPHEKVRHMHTACDEIRLMLETLFPL